jgi:hypothetical protein
METPYTDVLATMSHKIASYLEEISKQNARTARVFKSHLGDFDRFNDGRTDDVLQMIRDGKADVYEVLRSYASFLLKVLLARKLWIFCQDSKALLGI